MDQHEHDEHIARLDASKARLDELAAGIGMIIGQLAALERQQDTDA